MKLSQAQMARELHISRSTMSDNVRAGCPLRSVGEAKHWRSCNVREKWNQAAHDAKVRTRPQQADVEPESYEDDDELETPFLAQLFNGKDHPRFKEKMWQFTPEEFQEMLQIIKEDREEISDLKAELKECEEHLDYGLRLAYWHCPGGPPTDDEPKEASVKTPKAKVKSEAKPKKVPAKG